MTIKILVAYDGSELSKKAIEEVKKQAVEAEEKEVHIVSVVQPTGPATQPAISRQMGEEMAEKYAGELEGIKQQLGEDQGTVVTKVLVGEMERNPGQNICKYAEEQGADLIIIGSRGFGNVKRILLGSVSSNVVQHATCPVLVMK
ncbi:universal stress protein [Halobacillus fulvus]|nr:universal stress protein [Halobacillus fulvus]